MTIESDASGIDAPKLAEQLEMRPEFVSWLKSNCAIWREFCELADKMRKRRAYYSARPLAEIIRWNRAMRQDADDGFKLNDHWTPFTARLYNTIRGCDFFKTRERSIA